MPEQDKKKRSVSTCRTMPKEIIDLTEETETEGEGTYGTTRLCSHKRSKTLVFKWVRLTGKKDSPVVVWKEIEEVDDDDRPYVRPAGRCAPSKIG